jgi:hypothetical protein
MSFIAIDLSTSFINGAFLNLDTQEPTTCSEHPFYRSLRITPPGPARSTRTRFSKQFFGLDLRFYPRRNNSATDGGMHLKVLQRKRSGIYWCPVRMPKRKSWWSCDV